MVHHVWVIIKSMSVNYKNSWQMHFQASSSNAIIYIYETEEEGFFSCRTWRHRSKKRRWWTLWNILVMFWPRGRPLSELLPCFEYIDAHTQTHTHTFIYVYNRERERVRETKKVRGLDSSWFAPPLPLEKYWYATDWHPKWWCHLIARQTIVLPL